ncbi:MAG: CBS domain-containing protein [Candidatus Bathyarchaeia archaeon]
MPITTKVKDAMRVKVVTISPQNTVKEAIKLMTDNAIGSVVVVEAGEIAGILTERDCIRKCLAAGKELTTKIGDVMSKPVVTVNQDASLSEAVELMRRKMIRRLPVVDKANKLVGILTSDDVLRAIPTPAAKLTQIFGFNPFLYRPKE